jgi:A/G-specific adenine glycosylase
VFDETAKDALIAWYEANQRDLPWRQTRDPYRIMVSEIMLQQTQVDRVIPKYAAFLGLFPTLQALADAPASAVIRAWAGLGYNRRALNLQRACQAVVERHGGVMPRSVEELRALPGIGAYTAGAIACFAFEQDVGFVDTNIRRVLHRVEAGPELPEPLLTTREIAELADRLVPTGQGYVWNQALIELGALICRSRVTDCQVCPLERRCLARPTIQSLLLTAKVSPLSKKNQGTFETSSRYFRGRIVALLREAPFGLTADELAAEIDAERSEPDWIAPYVGGLLADGLLVARPMLAEESPPYHGEPASSRGVCYQLPD